MPEPVLSRDEELEALWAGYSIPPTIYNSSFQFREKTIQIE
jgi:hypothetical protein